MVRDSALDPDRLASLYLLKNYYINYVDGRLSVRNGYDRWNSTAMAAAAKQLFWFADPSGNEHLLGIVNGKWFKIAESGAHTQIDTQTATARRPITQVKERVFFGTDSVATTSEFMWADNTSIGSGAAYRVGIDKPLSACTAVSAASQGNITGVTEPNAGQVVTGGLELRLNADTQRRLAWIYVPGSDQTVSNVILRFMPVWASGNGSIKVSIYSGAGSPTTLVTNAFSDWVEITQFTTSTYVWHNFALQDTVTLSSGTGYWVYIESDADYKSNYNATNFWVNFAYSDGHASGTTLRWNAAWYDIGTARMGGFLIGGLIPGYVYDYKHTFNNDTYKSESRPSERSERITPNISSNRATIGTNATTDGQVDNAVIYRRNIGTDPTVDEDSITTDFEYVGTVTAGSSYTDMVGDDQLGGILGSDEHYLFDATADAGEGLRTTALVPYIATYWKSRVWFVEANANILYFSKIKEEDDAMGLTGDSEPDYFPLENVLEINEPSDIIALVPLSADELVVYFRNTSVWVIRGCDDVLNPPADIVKRQMITDVGLIAPHAVGSVRSRHVFLSRRGVYTFDGTTNREYLSGAIQSIFDGIADSSLDDSIIIANGDSIWIAVDENETADGKLNNIYILDLQRQVPTWRLYNYGVSIYDMVVRKTGTEYKTILASDADSNYILQLENGNDDNGAAIVSEVEFHDLVVPDIATIYQVSIDAYYPNVPPLYEITVTDSDGDVYEFDMQPRSIGDIAGHTMRMLVSSAIGARVKITQRTTNQNHLRAVDIGIVER